MGQAIGFAIVWVASLALLWAMDVCEFLAQSGWGGGWPCP